MAIYSFHMKTLGRSHEKSVNAVLRAAFHAGVKLTKLTDAEGNSSEIYDYSKQKGILHTEVLKPSDAPAWVGDREQLWNAVEAKEKRKDAQVAREVFLALPQELSLLQQIALVQTYAQDQFVALGMVADISIHKPKRSSDQRNFYTYILLTTRRLTATGFEDKKCREWNSKAQLRHWREQWANYANRALEAAGSTARIDHRTLREQGIVDREPTIHQGIALDEQEVKTADSVESLDLLQAESQQPLIATVEAINISVLFVVKNRKPIWQQFQLDSNDWTLFEKGMVVKLIPIANPKTQKVSYEVEILKG